ESFPPRQPRRRHVGWATGSACEPRSRTHELPPSLQGKFHLDEGGTSRNRGEGGGLANILGPERGSLLGGKQAQRLADQIDCALGAWARTERVNPRGVVQQAR